MSVGSVNSNVTFGQNQVKKSNSKRTAAYIAAGLGTAAAITGAVIYRKNIANTFRTLKDKFTPSTTNLVNSMDNAVENGKNKVKDIVDTLKETAKTKIDEGKEALNDAMDSEITQNIKDEAQGFFKNAGEFLKNAATKTWDYTKQAFNWVMEKVTGFFKEIKTFLSDLKKETAQQATAGAEKAANTAAQTTDDVQQAANKATGC